MLRLLACLGPLAHAAWSGDEFSLLQASVQNGDSPSAPKTPVNRIMLAQGKQFGFTRRVDAVEPGSSVQFSLQRGCSGADQYGVNNCTLRWGAMNKVNFSLHLGTGLHRGDRLISGIQSNAITHNWAEQAASGLFDGEEWEVASSCQVCEGSCNFNYSKLDFYIRAEYPTPITGDVVCSNLDKFTDIAVLNSSHLPVGPFGGDEFDAAYLKMVGDVNLRLGVENKEGAKRLDETFSFKVGGDIPPQTSLLQREQRHEASSKRRTLLGMLHEAKNSFLNSLFGHSSREGLATKQRAEKQQRGGPLFHRNLKQKTRKLIGKLSTVNVNYQVWYAENFGFRNLTISESQYCKSADAKGSFDCAFPFNKDLAIKVSAHLHTVWREGDTLDIKIVPKVDGLIGQLLADAIKTVKFSLPLCGTEVKEVTVMGKSFMYQPPQCGTYKLDAYLPPWRTFLPDLPKVPFNLSQETFERYPLAPHDFASMPPLFLSVTATVKHQDSSPFGSFTAQVSLD